MGEYGKDGWVDMGRIGGWIWGGWVGGYIKDGWVDMGRMGGWIWGGWVGKCEVK